MRLFWATAGMNGKERERAKREEREERERAALRYFPAHLSGTQTGNIQKMCVTPSKLHTSPLPMRYLLVNLII